MSEEEPKREEEPKKEQCESDEEYSIVREILSLAEQISWGDKIKDIVFEYLIKRWYGED